MEEGGNGEEREVEREVEGWKAGMEGREWRGGRSGEGSRGMEESRNRKEGG